MSPFLYHAKTLRGIQEYSFLRETRALDWVSETHLL